jgi:O-antigen/teichoic acid export membrane protein
LGVIVKQGIKGTFFSYLGAFLGYANWVFLLPLFMSKSEMGLVRVLMDSAVLLSTVFGFGIPQAIVRFYPFGNKNFSRAYFATFAFVALGAGLLFIPFFFLIRSPLESFFSEKAPLFNHYVLALIPIVLFSIAFDFFEAMNRIRLNITGGIFVKEVLFRLLIMLFITGYGFHLYGIDILIGLLVVCYGTQACAMGYLFLTRWSPDEGSLFPTMPSREQLRYMVLLLLGSGGTIIANQIDSVMTGGLKGLDYAAVYAMAFFMSSVVYMPSRSLNSISSSVVAAHFSSGNMEALRSMYRKSSLQLFLIGTPIFLGIWLNIDFIFSLIPEDKTSALSFADGKWVFFILGITRLFDMFLGINGVILVNSKYYLWHMLTMPLLALLTVITNLIFIPIMGINGAALATLISVIFFNVVRFLVLWIKLDMQPFTRQSGQILLLVSGLLGLSVLFSFPNYFLQIAYSILVILFGFFVPVYLLNISPDVNDTWRRFWTKLKPK